MANFIPDLDQIRDGVNFFATYVRKAFLAIQAKFPLKADDIASVNGSVINWTGSPVLPVDIIPTQQIATTIAGATFVNCIDILRNMTVQWKSDTELFLGPGHVLHRGLFKTQTCDPDGHWVSVVAASLNIPAECPVSPGTDSGLEKSAWYYAYAKLDTAGNAPEFRISRVPPVICAGRGPEHPTYEKMRFLGSFRTDEDGNIKAFARTVKGYVFWRDKILGPCRFYVTTTPDPENSTLVQPITGAGFIDIDLLEWCPPTAERVVLTVDTDDANVVQIRCTGDTGDNGGFNYQTDGHSGGDEGKKGPCEVPVNTIDVATGSPVNGTTVSVNFGGQFARIFVAGYVENLG